MPQQAITIVRSAVLAILLGCGSFVVAAPPIKGDRKPAEQIAAPADRAAIRVQGVGSCAAANCHGSGRGAGAALWASSYTTWATADPHAQAYQVLLDPRSQKMAKLLGKERLGSDNAHDSMLCLKCHSLQNQAEKKLPTALLVDGVGCESCHGAASEWRTRHYLDSWKTLKPADKQKLGYVDLNTPLARAKACVGCHVGAENQDVNHDLIAAGHPRLTFEFSAFQQKLPKHWDTKAERADPAFEAQSWAVGQAVSLSAAAKLLAARAKLAGEHKAPWPEFAEFDCFACHHDLQNKSWRRSTPRGGALGLPGWGTWYLPMAGSLAAESPEVLRVETASLQQSLDELSRSAQASWRTPNTTDLSTKAAQVAGQASVWAKALDDPKKYNAQAVTRLLEWATGDRGQLAQDWDGAAQLYLGIVALHESARRRQGAQPREAIAAQNKAFAAALKKLEFPRNFDSPRDFTPQEFQSELRTMHQLLGEGN